MFYYVVLGKKSIKIKNNFLSLIRVNKKEDI